MKIYKLKCPCTESCEHKLRGKQIIKHLYERKMEIHKMEKHK